MFGHTTESANAEVQKSTTGNPLCISGTQGPFSRVPFIKSLPNTQKQHSPTSPPACPPPPLFAPPFLCASRHPPRQLLTRSQAWSLVVRSSARKRQSTEKRNKKKRERQSRTAQPRRSAVRYPHSSLGPVPSIPGFVLVVVCCSCFRPCRDKILQLPRVVSRRCIFFFPAREEKKRNRRKKKRSSSVERSGGARPVRAH